MTQKEPSAACASCNKSLGGASEMCLTIGGKHCHVMICVSCHFLEIQRYIEFTGDLILKQQEALSERLHSWNKFDWSDIE